MQKTNIEYLNYSWSPVVMRCSPVSEGCRNCWHLKMCDRLAKNPAIFHAERRIYSGESKSVLCVFEKSKFPKKPSVIGVQFMGDLFHENVDDEIIEAVMEEIIREKKHTFVVLTKRPERMYRVVKGFCYKKELKWIDNLITGISISDKVDMMDYLLFTPAMYHCVSVEPMLGPVNLKQWFGVNHLNLWGINWVICGAESGPGRRECNVEWVRDLKDQCVLAGVPFFYKQGIGDEGIWRKMPMLDGKVWAQMPMGI